MYLEYYKLREFPFAISCDERYFYESAVHSEALANMMYTVQHRKGMVLVTGEVGAGKTFVSNMLGLRLGTSCHCVLLRTPPANGKQLLRALSGRIGLSLPPAADKLTLTDQLEDHLLRLHLRGRMIALLLDEAQDLSSASLEELRLLWNWEYQGHRLVQIVLIGQPELREKLQLPRWEPLRQRIVLSYHLGHLAPQDICPYISHRLAVASLAPETPGIRFTTEAAEAIFVSAGGIPRMINILCDNALLVGYSRGAGVIDKEIVREVLRDMTCWGIKYSPGSQANELAGAV